MTESPTRERVLAALAGAQEAKPEDVLQAFVGQVGGPTVEDVYNGMASEEKDVAQLIIGAAVEDVVLPDDQGYLDIYNGMTDDEKNVIHFIVGAALDPEFTLEHNDMIAVEAFRLDEELSGEDAVHFGTKGMKWGVRKSDSGGSSSSSSNRLSRTINTSPLSKELRSNARAKVKAGTGTLGDAHIASVKSTGHRVANGVLGDKTYWKRAAIIGGVGLAGVGASLAVPALLPASILHQVAAGIGGAHVVGNTAFATTSTGLATANASALGASILTQLGLAATYIGTNAASTVNAVSNIARAVTGNKRVDRSYAKLGNHVTKGQATGTKATRKVLGQAGGVRKNRLKQEDLPGISFDQKVADIDATHFGRKGMKWGVRRARGSDGRVVATTPDEVKQVLEARARIAKAGSLHGLSNEELRKVTERINLETNYVNSVLNRKTKLDLAHAKVKKGLDLGQTANKAITFGGSNAGQLLLTTISPRYAQKAYNASRIAKNLEAAMGGGKQGKKNKKNKNNP